MIDQRQTILAAFCWTLGVILLRAADWDGAIIWLFFAWWETKVLLNTEASFLKPLYQSAFRNQRS